MADIIDWLSDSSADTLRLSRRQAKENAQLSFEALFETERTLDEAFVVARRVAQLLGEAETFYADLAEDQPGVDSARTEAALAFTELLVLHPADATKQDVERLLEVFNADEVVALAQTISFLNFQLRVVRGLRALAGGVDGDSSANDRKGPSSVGEKKFSTEVLGWKPWVPALKKDELTETHLDALIKPERANMPYFRLLVRQPEALKARTLTDLDIFYNTDGGLTRAERELAATLASRFNGCPYCVSVHQRRAKEEGADETVVDRVIEEGVDADLASQRLNTIRDEAILLTATPIEFDSGSIERLRKAGLDDLEILDFIHSVAFFNWANRLMLTLGETTYPNKK